MKATDRLLSGAASAVALAAALGLCPQTSTADSAPAAQSMAAMRFMLGTWTCSVKAVDGSNPQVTTVTTMSEDGTRLLTKTTAGGDGTSAIWLDTNKNQWIQTSASAKGSSTQTSPGFTGSTLVWTGTLTANGMPTFAYRTTVTKLSDTKTQQLDELAPPGSDSWISADSAVCAKGR